MAGLVTASTPPEDEPSNQSSIPEEEREGESPADDAGEAPQKFTQEIVVTAGFPELPAGDRFQIEELEAVGTGDLGEYMRTEAGLSSARRGRINLDPQVRGLQETQIGVFVDGTRTFAAGPARMDSDLSHISLHAVSQMEVVKGPYALTWGAGSMSAIRLVTFKPPYGQDGWQGRAGARYDDNGASLDSHAGVSKSTDRWRFQLSGNHRQGEDYDGGDGVEVPGDYTSSAARWHLGLKPNAQLKIGYDGGFQRQRDLDYAGRLLDATYFYTRSHALDLIWTPTSAIDEVTFQLYSNRKQHLMNNDEKPTAQPNPNRIPPFPLRVDLPTESNTAGGRAQLKGSNDTMVWRLGSDYYRLRQRAERTVSRRDLGVVVFQDIVWPDAEIEDLGIYAQTLLGNERWDFGGAVRIDTIDNSAGETSEFFLENTTGPLDSSDTEVSAAVSATLRPTDVVSLFLGLGRAVRAPNALERYSDRFPSTKFQIAAEFMGDPTLEPEAGLQLDVGLKARSAGVTFDLSAFYRVIDDYITVTIDPSLTRRLPLSPTTLYRYVNGTEATFWGAEFDLRGTLRQSFQWSVRVDFVRGDDDAFDEPVFGLPPLVGRLRLLWSPPDSRLWVEGSGTFAAEQDRVAASRLEQPTDSHTTFDLRSGYAVNEKLDLELAVRNLTDEEYSWHGNTLDPFTGERILERGRTVSGAVSVRF